MKIEFDVDDNAFIIDLLDGMFVTKLKQLAQDMDEFSIGAWNEEDVKDNEDIKRACLTILQYYGYDNG